MRLALYAAAIGFAGLAAVGTIAQELPAQIELRYSTIGDGVVCEVRDVLQFRGDRLFYSRPMSRCGEFAGGDGSQGRVYLVGKTTAESYTCQEPAGGKVKKCTNGETFKTDGWYDGRETNSAETAKLAARFDKGRLVLSASYDVKTTRHDGATRSKWQEKITIKIDGATCSLVEYSLLTEYGGSRGTSKLVASSQCSLN